MRGLFVPDMVTNKHMDHWKFTMVQDEGNNSLDVCLLQSNITIDYSLTARGVVTYGRSQQSCLGELETR